MTLDSKEERKVRNTKDQNAQRVTTSAFRYVKSYMSEMQARMIYFLDQVTKEAGKRTEDYKTTVELSYKLKLRTQNYYNIAVKGARGINRDERNEIWELVNSISSLSSEIISISNIDPSVYINTGAMKPSRLPIPVGNRDILLNAEEHPSAKSVQDFTSYARKVSSALQVYEILLNNQPENADDILDQMNVLFERFQGNVWNAVSNSIKDPALQEDSDIFESISKLISDKFSYIFIKYIMVEENNKLRKQLEEYGVGLNTKALPTDSSTAQLADDQQPQLRSFAERLDHHRRAAGLTQRELAERAELTRSNISNLEAGRWEPRLNTILKLAETLNIDPCALLPKQPPRQR